MSEQHKNATVTVIHRPSMHRKTGAIVQPLHCATDAPYYWCTLPPVHCPPARRYTVHRIHRAEYTTTTVTVHQWLVQNR